MHNLGAVALYVVWSTVASVELGIIVQNDDAWNSNLGLLWEVACHNMSSVPQ